MQRKIAAMHEIFGMGNGSLCKGCCNLILVTPTSRSFYKRLAYGNTGGESTDWRLSYMACGLFGQVFDTTGRRPLIEQLKRATREEIEEPIEGQITI